MKEDIDLLIDDYKRRLKTLREEIKDGNAVKKARLLGKMSFCRMIIRDLEPLNKETPEKLK